MEDEPLTTRRFPIVGIGASAGGLEALNELLEHMPADTGMAFVVVTHQHPTHTSLLPELLARETNMKVVKADDGIKLHPNQVYVGIPGGQLTIQDGTLRREEHEGWTGRSPIDSFFRSLAEDQKEHAICIVLSGTGSDGTLGLKAIKANAGMTMVQLATSAKYAGMPSSAEATGMADYVLAPAEMPRQLAAYAQGPYLSELPADDETLPTERGTELESQTLARLFQLLQQHTGHDFSGYKVNTIRRRVERRMNLHQVTQPQDYLRFLEQTPREVDLLFKDLLISVTSFFRDPEAWQAFAAGPLLQLMSSLKNDMTLRAWVPGCATGEEVYTLAILMCECAEKLGLRLNYQLFGTDLDSAAIELARLGRFPAGIRADVSPQRLERFFVQEDGCYRICKKIREMAIFAPQNLIKDPPFTGLDVITCRNLLIYLGGDLQKQLIPLFHYALKPGGLLMLGASEATGNFADLFETVDKKWKTYRRNQALPTIHRVPQMPDWMTVSERRLADAPHAVSQVREMQIGSLLMRLALERFCPTFVVVNARGDLVYVHGRTGAYFELAEGQARTNVLDMARNGLSYELAGLLRLASATDDEVLRENVRVKTPAGYRRVRLEAKRVVRPEAVGGLIFIVFRPLDASDQPPPEQAKQAKQAKQAAPEQAASEQAAPRVPPAEVNAESAGSSNAAEDLYRELQFLRETHQATLQELETSNEELKSANEELQSTNEEMQSTNEELETSKEELQSLNEEVTTVNAELQSKVDDLSQANNDMQNLLDSTDIATIFLDDELRIKRYTVQAPRIVALRPTDVGRPLSDLSCTLRDVELERECQTVLDTLQHHKQRVETLDGTWYLMRILPYRTTDKVIDGLVLTFVNIQDLKDAETEGAMRAYFESIFETVQQPLVVLDEQFRVLSANRCYLDAFQLHSQAIIGQSFFEIDGRVWNQPALKHALDSLLANHTTLDGFKVERESVRLGKKNYILNAHKLNAVVTLPERVLLSIQELGPTDE